MPRKKIARQISRETKNTATYSDFIVVTLVFHVIIKLFLWVKFNPAHLQLLPYLECKQKQGKMDKKKTLVTQVPNTAQRTKSLF